MPRGEDAGRDRPDARVQRDHVQARVPPKPHRRGPHRSPEPRPRSDDAVELAAAARGKPDRLSIPGAGVSDGGAVETTLPRPWYRSAAVVVRTPEAAGARISFRPRGTTGRSERVRGPNAISLCEPSVGRPENAAPTRRSHVRRDGPGSSGARVTEERQPGSSINELGPPDRRGRLATPHFSASCAASRPGLASRDGVRPASGREDVLRSEA